MGVFREIFAWWTGNTIGTRVYTALRGRLVGEDELGNRYYIQRRGKGPLGVPRRWVVYRELSEPSLVPAAWHGWLHYTHDAPPTARPYQPRQWEKPHRPNMTGTPAAYRPPGSILRPTRPERPRGAHEPWRPQGTRARP